MTSRISSCSCIPITTISAVSPKVSKETVLTLRVLLIEIFGCLNDKDLACARRVNRQFNKIDLKAIMEIRNCIRIAELINSFYNPFKMTLLKQNNTNQIDLSNSFSDYLECCNRATQLHFEVDYRNLAIALGGIKSFFYSNTSMRNIQAVNFQCTSYPHLRLLCSDPLGSESETTVLPDLITILKHIPTRFPNLKEFSFIIGTRNSDQLSYPNGFLSPPDRFFLSDAFFQFVSKVNRLSLKQLRLDSSALFTKDVINLLNHNDFASLEIHLDLIDKKCLKWDLGSKSMSVANVLELARLTTFSLSIDLNLFDEDRLSSLMNELKNLKNCPRLREIQFSQRCDHFDSVASFDSQILEEIGKSGSLQKITFKGFYPNTLNTDALEWSNPDLNIIRDDRVA